MLRQILYTAEQLRGYDFVTAETGAMVALCKLMQAVLGGTTAVAQGLTATGDGSDLIVSLTAGQIYQLAQTDSLAVGLIAQNTTNILQQGLVNASTIALSTVGIAGGQSRYTLIQAQFNQVDLIPATDPTNGILPFYNAADPSSPNFLTEDTQRQGVVTVGLKTGTAATTGTEVPPSPDAGWVPLYLVDLAFGQTALSTGQILVAGPSVGTNVPSNYPYAPFLAGLLQSHHSGNPGQAPKINLATETQGLLPAAMVANMGDLGGVIASATDATFLSADFGKMFRLMQSASADATFTVASPFAGALAWINNNSSTHNLSITTATSPNIFFGFTSPAGYSQTLVGTVVLPPNSTALIIGQSGNFLVAINTSVLAYYNQLGNYAAHNNQSGDYTLLATDFGDVVSFTGASADHTFTTINGTKGGQAVFFANNSGFNLTIASGTAATFNGCGQAATSSFLIPPGGTAQIEWRSTNWTVLSATAFAGSAGFTGGYQSYTSSGTSTFTVPAGVTRMFGRCQGAGGAGAGSTIGNPGACGGAGGYSEGFMNVTPGASITITVGAGGTGVSGAAGNAGGTSSIGAFMSSTGGGGGAITPAAAGGSGGQGSGGDLNLFGGYGSDGAVGDGQGGASFFGGGGRAFQTTVFGNQCAPGGGGGGSFNPAGTVTGQAGRVGSVDLRW